MVCLVISFCIFYLNISYQIVSHFIWALYENYPPPLWPSTLYCLPHIPSVFCIIAVLPQHSCLPCVAVGFTNGTMRLVDSLSLEDSVTQPFNNTHHEAITKVGFTLDAEFLVSAVRSISAPLVLLRIRQSVAVFFSRSFAFSVNGQILQARIEVTSQPTGSSH